MPNQITGEYDAVVEARVEALNRILAILHRKGASEDASPSFPHSFAMRVDPVGNEIMQKVASKFGGWVSLIPRSLSSAGTERVPRSPKKAPPGASRVIAEATEMIAGLKAELITPVTPRGTAQVQLSTPTIFVPHGSTSEIVVSVQLRAHYIPDPDTPPLPAPIHGEIQATYFVELNTEDNKTVLEVKLTENDSQIQFSPAQLTNLSADDAGKIAAQIRLALRNSFEPMSLELPQDFPFERFKGLISGQDQVVALPVNLSGPEQPPSELANVNNIFLKSSFEDFAIALNKEFVEEQLQSFKDWLNAYETSFSVGWWIFTVTYNVSVSSVDLEWKSNSIDVVVKGSAVPGASFLPKYVLPKYDFTITQTLTLKLNTATQSVTLEHVGDPSISGLPGIAIGKVKSEIITRRTEALKSAQPVIQALMDSVTVGDALKSFYFAFDYSQYISLEIEPDGVILRGALAPRTPAPAVAQFTEMSDGRGFSALQSWIPGGTIERFEWSWATYKDPLPWKQKRETRTDEHSFILRFLPAIGPAPVPNGSHGFVPDKYFHPVQVGQVCLRVGSAEAGACQVAAEPTFNMPAWWGRLMMPIWWPDPPYDLPMDNAIVAHVNKLSHSRGTTAPGANAIVYFADEKWERPLETLGQTLLQSARRDAPVAVMLVLPRGSFRQPRSSFEERLGSLGQEFTGSFEVTADYEGGWTKMFGVESTPATYLVNARGEFVWQQVGPLDAVSLKAALVEHLISGTPPRPRLMRLTVRPGDRALDVLLDYGQGRQLALRRLRGQRVLLNFWKSWSTPCLEELRHLQRLHEQADKQELIILAINDGEDPKCIAEIRRKYKLTFKLIPDPQRRIARHYRVHCWPTTVSISEDGFVDHVHFGVTHHPPLKKRKGSRKKK